MNTIAMNTLTGAVTEYTGWTFQSVTPTHAGSATGLYSLGGDTDAGALIQARIQTGNGTWGASFKKLMGTVFFGLKGSGSYTLHVNGENSAYTYSFDAVLSGESRAKPGKGIRETYLSFGFSNPSGQDFRIDTIEVVDATSKTRKV